MLVEAQDVVNLHVKHAKAQRRGARSRLTSRVAKPQPHRAEETVPNTLDTIIGGQHTGDSLQRFEPAAIVVRPRLRVTIGTEKMGHRARIMRTAYTPSIVNTGVAATRDVTLKGAKPAR